MKKIIYVLMIFQLAAACGKNSNQGINQDQEKTEGNRSQAVCIWDEISVRETPEKGGKWITSMMKGETIVATGASSVDSAENVTYLKVELKDGTVGWSSANYIVVNAIPAVFFKEGEIYSRPDLLTKTKKSFSPLDIVAVTDNASGGDEWKQVIGKRKEGKWIETAWIEPSAISYDPKDLALAKTIQQVLIIEDESERLDEINNLILESDQISSGFYELLSNLKDELIAPKVETLEEAPNEVLDADSKEANN
jgi:hypothetical protein